MEGEPHGISDLCWSIFRCTDAWDYQRSIDWNHPFFFRDDYPDIQAFQRLSWDSAGTPAFPGSERKRSDPCD